MQRIRRPLPILRLAFPPRARPLIYVACTPTFSQPSQANSSLATSTMSTPAPRPSASLVVVNERNEILLVHRNPKASAFGGMHVSIISIFHHILLNKLVFRYFQVEIWTRSKTHLLRSLPCERLSKSLDYFWQHRFLRASNRLMPCWTRRDTPFTSSNYNLAHF